MHILYYCLYDENAKSKHELNIKTNCWCLWQGKSEK